MMALILIYHLFIFLLFMLSVYLLFILQYVQHDYKSSQVVRFLALNV
jgi:hypothetical protein